MLGLRLREYKKIQDNLEKKLNEQDHQLEIEKIENSNLKDALERSNGALMQSKEDRVRMQNELDQIRHELAEQKKINEQLKAQHEKTEFVDLKQSLLQY